METLAMQARKQPSGYTGLGVQRKYISICGSIFFLEWISLRPQKVVPKINAKRLFVSLLDAYSVLSVRCHARNTKSLKWLQYY